MPPGGQFELLATDSTPADRARSARPKRRATRPARVRNAGRELRFPEWPLPPSTWDTIRGRRATGPGAPPGPDGPLSLRRGVRAGSSRLDLLAVDGQQQVQPEEGSSSAGPCSGKTKRCPLVRDREVKPAIAIHVGDGDPAADPWLDQTEVSGDIPVPVTVAAHCEEVVPVAAQVVTARIRGQFRGS